MKDLFQSYRLATQVKNSTETALMAVLVVKEETVKHYRSVKLVGAGLCCSKRGDA
jgi:hypothetical protein